MRVGQDCLFVWSMEDTVIVVFYIMSVILIFLEASVLSEKTPLVYPLLIALAVPWGFAGSI